VIGLKCRDDRGATDGDLQEVEEHLQLVHVASARAVRFMLICRCLCRCRWMVADAMDGVGGR
jgi:hypothetical protein